MRQDIELLIELQEIDNKLSDLQKSRGDLPQRVEALRQQKDDLHQQLVEKENKIKENNTHKSRLELDIDTYQDKLKKYKEQLYAVTTNREYDAMTTEIDATEKNISQAEEKFLTLADQTDKMATEVEEDQKSLENLEKELQAREEELNNKLKESEDEERSLTHQREKISVRVSKRMYKYYERIRNAKKDSVAVTEIARNACERCYKIIPPQTVVEVRRHERLITCEGCARILV